MRYAKLCINILTSKYRNISNQKEEDLIIIENLGKVYIEKK